MVNSVPSPVDDVLSTLPAGDRAALNELLPLVYDDLRRLAGRYLRRERRNYSLQPTALVHETYLRLAGQTSTYWQNRSHFFGIAANLMRQILVEHARARATAKRGGGLRAITLSKEIAPKLNDAIDLLALDEALTELSALDPQKSRIIELRFFTGLDIDETAEVLGVSRATVIRQWRLAKAWVYRRLNK